MVNGGRRQIVLMFHLLQDVNTLRPLAFLAAAELDVPVVLLVGPAFRQRDRTGTWWIELGALARATGARLVAYPDDRAAASALAGTTGVLVAGSESDLPAHADARTVMRLAPSGYLKVTLQHGYECVGFLQSREHDIAHGRRIAFAADVLASWQPRHKLYSMPHTERSKVYQTGPSFVLNALWPDDAMQDSQPGATLVCENLQSARLQAGGDFRGRFVDVFETFCATERTVGRDVALRPHPGGQSMVRSGVALPAGIALANEPAWRTAFDGYAAAISAPSSVLIDLVAAHVPVAVWNAGGNGFDYGNYLGLHGVETADEWTRFASDARRDPAPFLARQADFLVSRDLPVDPAFVRARFARLLAAGRDAGAASVRSRPLRRLTIVANADLPTLQIWFTEPLRPLVDAGLLEIDLVTEQDMRRAHGKKPPQDGWVRDRLAAFDPDLIVFCRYSGPLVDSFLDHADARHVPTVFHIDDDMLTVPRELGPKKFAAHNAPERLATVSRLLSATDLVYCSTHQLAGRFVALGYANRTIVGDIQCVGQVINQAEARPARKIGYMGFDHAHDLDTVLPALIAVLDRHPELSFELFGSIPMPDALARFGDRVVVVPPVRPYAAFMAAFAERRWDIGICPLAPTAFNKLKSNNKWVEYTAAGVASVASRGYMYDECCAECCGLLVDTLPEWEAALETLIADPLHRATMVTKAQDKLQTHYTVAAMRDQFALVTESLSLRLPSIA